jgi:putative transposase
MILTFKYRLLPTRKQHAALNSILEQQRLLYNAALEERIDAYQRSLLEVDRGLRGKPVTITYFDQTNSLTQCRQEAGSDNVPAFLQRWTLKRLDDAYQAFFRRVRTKDRKPGFPRYRGRDYWRSFGFSHNGGFRVGGVRPKVGFIGLPGYHSRKWTPAGNIPGGIRLHLDRSIPDRNTIRAIALSRDPGGRKWVISIQSEIEPEHRCQSKTAAVGIDVGVNIAIAQSDGGRIGIPKSIPHLRKAEKRAQRALARARRGSGRRQKTKSRLARLKAKEAAIRKHWQHVQSARLTRCYSLIKIEGLNVINMTRSAKGTVDNPGTNVRAKSGLNREILSVGWAELADKLVYKAERDRSRLIKVDPRGTSQHCSWCGSIVEQLSDRRIYCSNCGHAADRDHNAARNILFAPLPGSENVGLPLGGDLKASVGAPGLGNTDGASRPDGAGYPAHLVSARMPMKVGLQER